MSDILSQLEAEQERRHQRVREMLANNPHALAEFDAGMEEIRSGRATLRSCWHSLSAPQRRIVQSFLDDPGDLHRAGVRNTYYKNGVKARWGTVHALVKHRLLRWNGAGVPTEQATLTGRGWALLEVIRGTN